jgi:hypothetical protein
LLFGCEASVRGGMGRLDDMERPPERLVDLRVDGRADFIVAVRGRDTLDFGLAVDDFGLAVVALAAVVLGLAVVDRRAAVDRLAVVRDRVVEDDAVVRGFAAVRGLVTLGLAVDALGLAARGLDALLDREDAGLGFAALRVLVLAIGLAADMVLAAAVSAFAAVAIDLVAVFIDRMADDIVLAEVVALVAAAVILLAADVTLVAAEDMFLAAAIGVAELLVEELRRAEVRAREAVPRVDRDAVLLVEREAVLRVEREAGLRAVDEAVPALAIVERVDLRALLLVFGRLAVPDALRLTDLLRAALAELRRLAARVVVLTGTEFPPVLINYGGAIPPAAEIYTHSDCFSRTMAPKPDQTGSVNCHSV